MKIRSFIAADPSEEVLRNLSSTVQSLAKRTVGFRWVRPEAIHLTLRFLGEIEEEMIATIDGRLAQLAGSFEPMSLEAAGLGFFPGPEKPRIVWAGLTGEIDRLADLQRHVQETVEDLSVHQEKDRAFAPHLTLARIPNFRGASGVSAVLKAASEARFGAFTVDRLFLYKSRLTPEGASYTKLKEYPLRRP
ncbi:MAG TPA: RNA 2',3'-cyclic phosphodiesterase [bacterium]|nr:RNA 2',3'-cyclic phosphodiesterase [bacterium]